MQKEGKEEWKLRCFVNNLRVEVVCVQTVHTTKQFLCAVEQCIHITLQFKHFVFMFENDCFHKLQEEECFLRLFFLPDYNIYLSEVHYTLYISPIGRSFKKLLRSWRSENIVLQLFVCVSVS